MFKFKVESSGGNHRREGGGLSKEEWEGSGQVPFLLAERARSEGARPMRAVKGNLGHSPWGEVWGNDKKIRDGLIVFCARATRGLRRPSLGLMARLGVPVGGRVRRLRAVEDQSAPIPREKTSKLGGHVYRSMRAGKSSLGCSSKERHRGGFP